MSSASYRQRRSPSELSEDDLHRMLEEAECRREVELKTKSRAFLIFIVIPIIAVLTGAAGIAIKYQAIAKPVAARPAPIQPAEAPLPQVVDLKETGDLDFFSPKAMRTENSKQPAAAPKQGWQMVDKGDISFAMQLLDFVQPPAKKEDAKP